MKSKKKTKILIGIVVFLLLAIASAVGVFFVFEAGKTETYYLASENQMVELNGEDGKSISLPRGVALQIKTLKKKIDDIEYRQFKFDDVTYYVLDEQLESDRRNCVREKQLVSLRSHILTDNYDSFVICGWLNKNETVNVSGYHELNSDGSVDYYLVNDCGYIDGKYLSKEFYETGYDGSIYGDVFYGEGGDPTIIEYYPKDTLNFENNTMPEIVKALYINAEAVSASEYYIDIANRCGINAFVVDIKDCYIDTQLAYESPVGKIYAPSTYNIPNSFDTYSENLKKLKDAGYYLIGRITAFKDDAFAIDNEDEAYMYEGRLYNYGSVKWPSVFSRKMWEYNVALASEAVDEFGFNEIQFDYCRLPEDVEDVELRNTYGETRTQAVTNFLRYASEFLHKKEVYVSADVFGETSGDKTDEFSAWSTSYGQFWPAISNAVDVISSMPYPDHFSYGAYDIYAPWEQPEELMYCWGKATYYAQQRTYDSAKCRTWIEAQSPDLYDVYYDVDEIAGQISGLKKANVYDGFMTWSASSSLSRYEAFIDAFN